MKIHSRCQPAFRDLTSLAYLLNRMVIRLCSKLVQTLAAPACVADLGHQAHREGWTTLSSELIGDHPTEPRPCHDTPVGRPDLKCSLGVGKFSVRGSLSALRSSHAPPHVGHARSDPDPRSCWKLNHFRRLSRIERNSAG